MEKHFNSLKCTCIIHPTTRVVNTQFFKIFHKFRGVLQLLQITLKHDIIIIINIVRSIMQNQTNNNLPLEQRIINIVHNGETASISFVEYNQILSIFPVRRKKKESA